MALASEQLKDFIKGWEQCSLKPYRDQGGRWTIGWGHLMHDGDPLVPITQQEADALFEYEVMHMAEAVDQLRTYPMEQFRSDALVSFAYNLGHEALETSRLLRLANKGQFADAALEFEKWDNVRIDGVLTYSEGVAKRRRAECAIFCWADYSGRP